MDVEELSGVTDIVPLPSCRPCVLLEFPTPDSVIETPLLGLFISSHVKNIIAGGFELVNIVDMTDHEMLTGFEDAHESWWRLLPAWLRRSSVWCL